ncbi:LysM peptidoglycan-binding domain-containing protein [Geodermatophilus sp. SYSU D01045]
MATFDYTVVAGDTLNKIAKKFGVTVAEILAVNPQITDPDVIRVGQVIRIPEVGGGDGEAAVKSYAIVVNVSGGSARRSDPGIDPDRVAVGEYDVTFPEDISAWLWQPTLAPADDTDQTAGFVTAELGDMGSPEILKVRTFNAAGNPQNRAFHLHVRDI